MLARLGAASTQRDFAATVGSAMLGAALITACAQLRIPMWPVPMTMQPFAVLLVAGACGRGAAVSAVLLYLAAAGLRLPVLASAGSGLGGPITGYLLSYGLVAAILPTLRERGWLRHPAALLGALAGAMALVYFCGVSWLSAFWLHDSAVALANGMLPFLPSGAIKLLLAFCCLLGLRRPVFASQPPCQ